MEMLPWNSDGMARSWWAALLAPPLPGVTGWQPAVRSYSYKPWPKHGRFMGCSHDFPMIFPIFWDFPMIFRWFSQSSGFFPWFSDDFPNLLGFSHDFPMIFPIFWDFPMIFRWFSHEKKFHLMGIPLDESVQLSPPPWDRAVSSRMHLGKNWGYGDEPRIAACLWIPKGLPSGNLT